MKFSTQILFVSGQMVPNVTPLLDASMRPDNAVLCATDTMREKAGSLKIFLEQQGINAEIFPLGDAYEFEDLQSNMLDLAARYEDPGQVGVNITGETKLITIAAQAVFSANGFSCFYVMPEKDQALLLGSTPLEKLALDNCLKLEDYFAIHGYTVRSIQRENRVKPGFRRLALALLENPKLRVGELNYLAAKAEDAYSLKVKNNISEKSWDVLHLFMEYGAISYYDDKNVEFADGEGRSFCKGFWLEDYVMLTLKDIAAESAVQDFASSIQIESKAGVRNEIDAAFLHENRLYIIECKTANMRDRGNEAVYKIDTIKNDTGLFSVPILISFNRLPAHVAKRARDQKITIFEGQILKNLGPHLTARLSKGGSHA